MSETLRMLSANATLAFQQGGRAIAGAACGSNEAQRFEIKFFDEHVDDAHRFSASTYSSKLAGRRDS